MSDTVALATYYILLVKECRELDAALKKRKEERDAKEQEVLAVFQAEGVQSIKTKEGLAYLSRTLWSSLAAPAEQLRGTCLEWLVKPNVNTQTLSSTVREWIPQGEDFPIIPKEVKDLIKITEVFKVGVRS